MAAIGRAWKMKPYPKGFREILLSIDYDKQIEGWKIAAET
jgi:hypothetical protein